MNPSMLVNGLRRLVALRLFRRADAVRAPSDIIRWWEWRRLPFNLLVGAAGVVSSTLVITFATLRHTECGLPDPPLFAPFGVFAYAVAANVCFTAGWVVELVVLAVWGEAGRSFGPIVFGAGVMFSVLLSLAPGVAIPALCLLLAPGSE